VRRTRRALPALARLNLSLTQHAGRAPVPRVAPPGTVVLEVDQTGKKNAAEKKDSGADGVVGEGALFILDDSVIDGAAVLVRRKRTGCPATTPAALAQLRKMAGLPEAPEPVPAPEEFAEMAAHLTEMSGAAPELNPLFFSAGLCALASLWFALAAGAQIPPNVGGNEQIGAEMQIPPNVGGNGEMGVEVLMASTAYGGSSQLTDLVEHLSAKRFRKHTFDVTGAARVEDAVSEALTRLESFSSLLPRTVLFLENPTNPDMKYVNLSFFFEFF
jgi:hypothetical protein